MQMIWISEHQHPHKRDFIPLNRVAPTPERACSFGMFDHQLANHGWLSKKSNLRPYVLAKTATSQRHEIKEEGRIEAMSLRASSIAQPCPVCRGRRTDSNGRLCPSCHGAGEIAVASVQQDAAKLRR